MFTLRPYAPTQTQSITVPRDYKEKKTKSSKKFTSFQIYREQSLLQELNTLDEAYFVHNYISKKEYEEYRQKVINKWRGQEKKSFWNRMWDTACRCGNFIFKNLLTSIISNLGSSLIGGFTGHSGFIGQ
ncbi:unnamed protein product [Rhizophagus irregularis]|nr:unnamed protein product [Rhizophagus irregularis]